MSEIEHADQDKIRSDPSRKPLVISLGNGRWATRNVNPYRFAKALREHNEDKRKRDHARRCAELKRLESR